MLSVLQSSVVQRLIRVSTIPAPAMWCRAETSGCGWMRAPERCRVTAVFAFDELHDHHEAHVGDLTLTISAVAHGIPEFALRIEAADQSLVYSGDTAPCRSLTTLAEGCDVLLCEAGSAEAATGAEQAHHSPEDAGDTARAARAQRLIVTHVERFLTPKQAEIGRAHV